MVCVRDTRTESGSALSRAGLAVALALAAGGCRGTGFVAAADDASVLPDWRELLGAAHAPRCLPWAAAEVSAGAGAPCGGVLVVDANWRPPDGAATAQQRAALRQCLEAGGRVVLFGHAAQLVAELGVEPERPECSVYRWGFDARTVRGEATLGLAVVSGRLPELFVGLAAPRVEHALPLTGARPCTLPLCAWSVGEPRQGEVLARLFEERDGTAEPSGAPVLVRWQCGAGELLACGLLPAIAHPDAAVRANARAFVRNCADWAAGGTRRPLVLHSVAERGPPPVAPAPVDGPGIVPLLAHWGWQASLRDADDGGGLRPPAELVDDALAPSWRSGADVFAVQLVDGRLGAAVPWSDRDPMRRPESWRGGGDHGPWDAGGFGVLADEAHGRGMLVFGDLDPLPVGDRPTERLVALRYLARELACVRRLGARAFDGFAVRQWWPDRDGYGVAMLQDFRPSAVLLGAGEQLPALAGGLRALDADDGAPRGLALAGVHRGWRDGFPADLFPCGVLDARATGERWPGTGVRGGGSHGDWLLRQWNDFVRERRRSGATALWRRHDPRTLGPDTDAFVRGLGLEPLVAAVATPLSATGRDGVRAAAAALLPEAPPGFGGEVDAPAAVHCLGNNWFRLLGSGGELRWDPTGTGRFDAAASVVVSPALLATRLVGARPDAAAVQDDRRDFLVGGTAGEGGYGRVARAGDARPGGPRPPAVLAVDREPAWPAAVVWDWQPAPGYHELTVALRAERGDSLVALSIDDVLLRCVAVRGAVRAAAEVVPVHIATTVPRALRVEVLDGGAVAIDRLTARRVGDIGVEARVDVPAGSVARLTERSHASCLRETTTWTAIADLPAFVVRVRTERADRNLQVHRRISLPGYAPVGPATAAATDAAPGALWLRAAATTAPDLLVVPLQRSRYEELSAQDEALLWRAAPEAGGESCVAFLLCAHGAGDAWLPHAARVLAAIDRPQPVDLGPDGEASLATDLTVPWNRVLHLAGAAATPFAVRERGWWSWRGSQPAPDGGAWLRIVQEPGDVVQVVGGPAVLARTRPGPGSLRVIALRDPTPRSATVQVLQPSRLGAPSVVMAADFDEVSVDGRPWAWFDGRTVFLPDRAGTYRIEANRHGGGETPHVRCTGAPLERCSWVPERGELVLATAGAADRPAELAWTAVLAGPAPSGIENGELVEPASLCLRDAAAAAAVARGGVLIRFRSGITTVHYGERTQ